jgi:hypothetical protein
LTLKTLLPSADRMIVEDMDRNMKQNHSPLHAIFEDHLYNLQDPQLDRKAFIERVVREYLSYLRGLKITIPDLLRAAVQEELLDQVETMLLKRTYGTVTLQEFRKKAKLSAPRKVRTAR